MFFLGLSTLTWSWWLTEIVYIAIPWESVLVCCLHVLPNSQMDTKYEEVVDFAEDLAKFYDRLQEKILNFSKSRMKGFSLLGGLTILGTLIPGFIFSLIFGTSFL